MSWYNYKAPSLNTGLSGNTIIESSILQEFIEGYQANSNLYHCYYDLEKRQTFVNYEGLMRPVFDTIHIDLDSDDGGETAWAHAKEIATELSGLNIGFHIYFSGNKGFHIAVHKTAVGILEGPKEQIEFLVKSLLLGMKERWSSVDTGIWNANRKFRAYRSQHEKSGLYKIRLTGVGLDLMPMSIDQIRNLAIKQPSHKYAHPSAYSEGPSDFFKRFIQAGSEKSSSPGNTSKSGGHKVKEIPQGQRADDESLKFRNFNDKKCIRRMEETNLPQFNRHDIGLRLMCDLWAQGISLDDAQSRMESWAKRVFVGDPERVKDTSRQTRDVYAKPQDYQFSCYDDVKQAYCSAKCKLYEFLDRKTRPEPVDTSPKQKKENKVRDNKNSELSEGQIADRILGELPRLVKFEGQYFQWIDTHWKRIDGQRFEDLIKKSSMQVYDNKATIRQVEALAKHVLTKIETAPEENHFFTASPTKFNFTDCTANVVADLKGNLRLEMKAHNPNDFLASCAPFPLFGSHDLKRGTEFSKYLETRRADVGDDGIRIIKQMLGAALVPYAPRIFFIEGVTNAGKSTLALLIKRLLGPENVSEIQPVVQGGGADRFAWESGIGKLANIVLELDERKPLDTTLLKMVRDKAPVSLDRKGRVAVRATLPFFHVYCCNAMPPSLEGNSGALNNRVTMLHFKPGYLNGSSGIVEYAEHIWNEDPGGVLEAAREGLKDLMESGFKYFETESSRDSVKVWQKRNDALSLYIEDVRAGEWKPQSLEMKQWEKGTALYSDFKAWCGEVGKRAMGRNTFYDQLRKKAQFPSKDRTEDGAFFDVSNVWPRETGLRDDASGTKERQMQGECKPNASIENSIISNTLTF